jgi:ADP-ribose pyrophosphatase YjhB (NUDIX family)
MKFCSNCGNRVEQRIPDGDDRPRYVCSHCSTIHYQNPRVIVGCLATHGERVLMCRRAIEPRHGFWTLPAGFMENGESAQQGALRETWEEARAKVGNEIFYRMFDLPHINQIYLFYRGELINGEHGVGPESLESALFAEHEIPWNDVAFPVMVETLREFFGDCRAGTFPVRATGLPSHWHDWLKRPASS